MKTDKFYNYLTVGVLAVGLLFIAGVEYSKAADATFVKQVVNPVLQLERNCSGVVIDTADEFKETTYLVTANHCVSGDATPDPAEKSGFVTVDVKDKEKVIETQQYVYDVVIRDTSNDLAMIKLRKQGLNLDGAFLGHTDPQEGDDVWTVGYSLGLPRSITQGFFGGFLAFVVKDGGGQIDQSFGNGVPKYKASPAIVGGNSGGGMFVKNNDKYELVGIADMVANRFANSGFYNPQEKINDLVDRGLKTEKEAYKVEEDKRSQK